MSEEAMQKRNKKKGVVLDVVNAADVEDSGDFLNLQEDFFELLAVAHIQGNFYAGMQMFADAFEGADIGFDGADCGGDFGKHTGAVFGEDAEADGENRVRGTGPFRSDAAFCFIEEILDVGTRSGVNGHAATARDVADDVIAGNRITT